MNFVIWGAGCWGKEIFEFLGESRVEAFIDSDITRIGSIYCNKKVITLEEYITEFSDYFIIVAVRQYKEIIEVLVDKEIYKFFILEENPSELFGFGQPNIFNKEIFNYGIDEVLGIYGITLFGILLYEYLVDSGYLKVALIPHKECHSKLVELIENQKSYKVETLALIDNELDKLLLVYEDDIIYDNQNPKYRVDRYFDLSDKINSYHNDSIEKLYNVHKDMKRCFIIATGPSLTIEDLNKLKENMELTISMNSIFTAYRDTDWRSDYYVVGDRKIIEQCEDDICNLEAKVKFVSDRNKLFWNTKRPNNILKFHVARYPEYCTKKKFSENFAQKAYAIGTVTYLCIQLAVYLGIKEIILLGVDFNYINESDDPQNHINGRYYHIKNPNKVSYEKGLVEYTWAKEYAEANNIKIYNATRGGKLDVFERIDFDKLF